MRGGLDLGGRPNSYIPCSLITTGGIGMDGSSEVVIGRRKLRSYGMVTGTVRRSNVGGFGMINIVPADARLVLFVIGASSGRSCVCECGRRTSGYCEMGDG